MTQNPLIVINLGSLNVEYWVSLNRCFNKVLTFQSDSDTLIIVIILKKRHLYGRKIWALSVIATWNIIVVFLNLITLLTGHIYEVCVRSCIDKNNCSTSVYDSNLRLSRRGDGLAANWCRRKSNNPLLGIHLRLQRDVNPLKIIDGRTIFSILLNIWRSKNKLALNWGIRTIKDAELSTFNSWVSLWNEWLN